MATHQQLSGQVAGVQAERARIAGERQRLTTEKTRVSGELATVNNRMAQLDTAHERVMTRLQERQGQAVVLCQRYGMLDRLETHITMSHITMPDPETQEADRDVIRQRLTLVQRP